MLQRFQQVILFEDDACRTKKFLPLTYLRPVSLLRTGLFTQPQRIYETAPGCDIIVHSDKPIQPIVRERHGLESTAVQGGQTLFLNARLLLTHSFLQIIERTAEKNHLYLSGESVAAAIVERVDIDIEQRIIEGKPLSISHFSELSSEPTSEVLHEALWDIIHANGQQIKEDVRIAERRLMQERSDRRNIYIERPAGVFIHPTAIIGAGVAIDASLGPVIIEADVKIFPQVTIIGPAAVGKNSIVKIGAKIYEGTTIGPRCKVGGEVENSIFLSYSNKQHDGYLGHSMLGEWVNLGADTNTSDLKNDYSSVKVTIEDEDFDTKSMFVGLMMGDHSKSAINTQFNTGTVVGVNCNIFDSGFPPKWIPSFSWGGPQGFTEYRFEKAIKVARIVTERRQLTLTKPEEDVLRSISERASLIKSTSTSTSALNSPPITAAENAQNGKEKV